MVALAGVAQLAAQLSCKQQVRGSSPLASSTDNHTPTQVSGHNPGRRIGVVTVA